MGTISTAILGNDTSHDIYQDFYALYNQGQDPELISKEIINSFGEMFHEDDERNDLLLGLALAQWETKSLDPVVFAHVKEIIETGLDLKRWRGLGADESMVVEREATLAQFLAQLSTPKSKPKRRIKPKFEFSSHELVKITAPDNKKTFMVTENYTNGIYNQTAALLMWHSDDDKRLPIGGSGIFSFIDYGKPVNARWIDSQTLEIIHEKGINFHQEAQRFFFNGDEGTIIYRSK